MMRRHDGIDPAWNHRQGEVGRHEEVDEYEHHEVKGAQDGQQPLVYGPLTLSATPMLHQWGIQQAPQSPCAAFTYGRHVGQARDVEDAKSTDHQHYDTDEIGIYRQVAVEGDFEPYRASPLK